jgi:hypothetical protein
MAGAVMLVVLAGAAEMERNLTRERTRSALAVKRANEQRIGTVPYGFDLADDRSTLIPNDAEGRIETPRDRRHAHRAGRSHKDRADEMGPPGGFENTQTIASDSSQSDDSGLVSIFEIASVLSHLEGVPPIVFLANRGMIPACCSQFSAASPKRN